MHFSQVRKLIYVSKNEPINVPQNCHIYKTHRVNALRQIPNAWYKFKALKTDLAQVNKQKFPPTLTAYHQTTCGKVCN